MLSQKVFKEYCITKKVLPVIHHSNIRLGTRGSYRYVLRAGSFETEISSIKYSGYLEEIKGGINE